MIIPADITAKHCVRQEDVFRHGAQAGGIEDAVFEFATMGSDHLLAARDAFNDEVMGGRVPTRAMPIFLTGVRLYSSWDQSIAKVWLLWLAVGSGVELSNTTGESQLWRIQA
jgi:hypothetical protein